MRPSLDMLLLAPVHDENEQYSSKFITMWEKSVVKLLPVCLFFFEREHYDPDVL